MCVFQRAQNNADIPGSENPDLLSKVLEVFGVENTADCNNSNHHRSNEGYLLLEKYMNNDVLPITMIILRVIVVITVYCIIMSSRW